MMQPANDEHSRCASEKLVKTGICDFDTKLDGPRLQAICSGMRFSTSTEAHYQKTKYTYGDVNSIACVT